MAKDTSRSIVAEGSDDRKTHPDRGPIAGQTPLLTRAACFSLRGAPTFRNASKVANPRGLKPAAHCVVRDLALSY